MKTILTTLILFALMSFKPFKNNEQLTINSEEEQMNLFQLHEIDLHVHAGKERPFPLNEWIDLFVKDGRKVLVLLDHLELYRMDEKENKEWIAKNKLTDWYPNRETAKTNFMKDAEVIGWHISKAAWDGKAPSGKEIIHRVKQILEVQKEFPVPMIIFHPFAGYYEQVRTNVMNSGRKITDIKNEDYHFFTASEQKELITIVKGKPVFFEISRDWETLWDDPVARKAFIEDIKPLTDTGVKFTVSTDAHNNSSFNKPYQPEKYCADLGISPENVNTIIQELLEKRVEIKKK